MNIRCFGKAACLNKVRGISVLGPLDESDNFRSHFRLAIVDVKHTKENYTSKAFISYVARHAAVNKTLIVVNSNMAISVPEFE